jgi:hypothetical protein
MSNCKDCQELRESLARERELHQWIEIKEGCEMHKEDQEVRVVAIDDNSDIGGDVRVYQDVWSYRDCPAWRPPRDRQYVSHWRPLDWPDLLEDKAKPVATTEKEKS